MARFNWQQARGGIDEPTPMPCPPDYCEQFGQYTWDEDEADTGLVCPLTRRACLGAKCGTAIVLDETPPAFSRMGWICGISTAAEGMARLVRHCDKRGQVRRRA